MKILILRNRRRTKGMTAAPRLARSSPWLARGCRPTKQKPRAPRGPLAMTSMTGNHLATGSDSVRVAIAGGGIGGMALALSLHAAGLTEVDVYESARSVKELGVGINVQPHATRELTELGLLDELYAVGIPTAELAYYSRHGQRIWSEPRGLAAGYRWPQFSIHRGALLGVLYRAVRERLGPERVHSGRHLARFEQYSR